MYEILVTYKDDKLVNEILSSKDYVKFTINECTIDALENKADYIMKCHNYIWVPLCITYHPSVRVYDKVYYLDKRE